ncbi:hypothetical protein PIB30_073153 [Stylosanthes scabra]|uniref:Uncharacterized protein n=1 Tax=Stylosanthes scabra TaxID=79078 RepID=A0ABU6VNZ9_9FABA|nr:hypothetical protein [Stylosanthes scabra]
MHQCKRFVKVACLREDNFKQYSEMIMRHTLKLEGQNGLCRETDLDEEPPSVQVNGAVGVGDPARVRTKGTAAETNHSPERPLRDPSSESAAHVAGLDTGEHDALTRVGRTWRQDRKA